MKIPFPSYNRALRNVSSLLCATLLFLLASCSTDVSDDMKTLLGSVPRQSPAVVAINLEKSIEQCGGKVSGGKLKDFPKDSKLFSSPVESATLHNIDRLKEAAQYIKMSAAVGFYYNGEFYLTTLLNDPKTFREEVVKQQGFEKEWTTEDGIDYNSVLAVADDRLWVGSGRRPLEQNVKQLMSLSEAESFLSDDYSKTLCEGENAVEMYASLDGVLSQFMGFAMQAQVKMGLNLFFSDPQYLVGRINYTVTGGELEAKLLNGKYKPAKCELELSKIDPATVAALGGNADEVVAISVSQKLVKQLVDFGKSFGGSLPASMLNLLNPLDGTIAFASPVAAGGLMDALENFRGVVTTNGLENAQLSQSLGAFGKVDIEGKVFNVSKGRYGEGKFVVKDVADAFKDAWLGIAIVARSGARQFPLVITFVPDDGSLALKASLEK